MSEVFKLSSLPEEYRKLFVADGGLNIPENFRSPWHDSRELKSKGNKRDFLCNVWMTPIGSSDAVFDHTTMMTLDEKFIRPPDYMGEVLYDEEDEYVGYSYFQEGYGLKRLHWWGELRGGRPNPAHNYIIGCDPSFGRGSSNSVAAIVDVNTAELVGIWACSNTREDDFADQVVALGKWIGGVEEPFIIWESNGANGKNFGERVVWQGWDNYYFQRAEDSTTRKKMKKLGWRSGPRSKGQLLGELNIALTNGVNDKMGQNALLVYSQDLLDELNDYIHLENSDQSLSAKADLTTGARERHGDRVIATALCVLGMKEQLKGEQENIVNVPVNTFEHRFREYMEQQEIEKRRKRRFLF